MPILRVRLPRRAKTEFPQAVINDICRNLYAVDCQLCGKPLGIHVPALTVIDFDDSLQVIAHHETCSPPRWGRPVVLAERYFLSYRLLDLQIPSTFLGGSADGAKVDLPVLLVNPSLEAVFLARDEGGTWRVDTVDRYVRRGLRVGSPAIPLVAVPGSVAHLGLPVDGSSPALTVQLSKKQGWPLRVNPAIAADIRRLQGVALVVTTALDPLGIGKERVGEEFHALLRSGNCAAGWIPLAGTQRTFHGEPVAEWAIDRT